LKTLKFYKPILKLVILAVFYPCIVCSIGMNHDYKVNSNEFLLSGPFSAYSETQNEIGFRQAPVRYENVYFKLMVTHKSMTTDNHRSITTDFIVTPGDIIRYLELPEIFNDNKSYFFNGDFKAGGKITEETAKSIQKQEGQEAVITDEDRDESKNNVFNNGLSAQENGSSQNFETVEEETSKNIDSEENAQLPYNEIPAGNLSMQEDVMSLNDTSCTDPLFIKAVQDIADKAAGKANIKNPVGVYVKELNTGNEFGINENLTVIDEFDGNTDGYFRAASVVKLQMAYVAYRLIERGELPVDKTYYDSVTKKEFKLLPALHQMVSHSDNNLFNTMLRLIGREKTNKTLIEYGILNSPVYGEISPAIGYSRENNIKRHGTTKVGGKITPKDMGIILEAIYKEKDENIYMECFNKALIANIYNSRIPEGIGYKYPVAHKTGTADSAGTYNDAGIIYCKNPFILVVLTKGESSANAQNYIRELAKELTNYMDQRAQDAG